MTVAPMQCPRCSGPFQIESTSAGLQVGCPHCGQPVQIPPLDQWEQSQAVDTQAPPPPPEMPAAEPPPPAELAAEQTAATHATSFNCPHCSGEFQITPDMSGMQVGCPHCQQAMQLPEIDSTDPASGGPPPPPPPAGSHSYQAPTGLSPQEAAFMRYPTGTLVGQPATSPPPQKAPPPEKAEKPTSQSPAQSDSSHLYPPGFTPPTKAKQSTPQPKAEQKSPPADDRSFAYPPGFEPKSMAGESKQEPAWAKQEKPVEASSEPATQETDKVDEPTDSHVDSLLPPAAQPTAAASDVRDTHVADEPPADQPTTAASFDEQKSTDNEASPEPDETEEDTSAIDSLLPPGAAPVTTPSASQPAKEHIATAEPSKDDTSKQDSKLDSLLPPSAPAPTQAIEVPTDWQPAPQPDKSPEGTVLIPTDEGNFTQVYEPRRTVGYGDDEVELRKLTPEEKARRRMFRNVIMWIIGTLILTGTLYLLTSGVLL